MRRNHGKMAFVDYDDEKTRQILIPSKIEPVRVPIFHVDAFAEGPFSGNPAAVCLLDSWLDDWSLRKVAAENSLFATAFLVPIADRFELRWFTTLCEIRLCGHATLAAGFVVLELLKPKRQAAHFETSRSGALTVRKAGESFAMDFPALFAKSCENRTLGLAQALALKADPIEVLEVNDTYIAVFENESTIATAVPDFRRLEELHPFVVAITARGESDDFVSRYFAPGYGVPEDYVTGSLHCALTPYWAKVLGKTQLHARQLSEREGQLWCELAGERVILKGKAVLTMRGILTI